MTREEDNNRHQDLDNGFCLGLSDSWQVTPPKFPSNNVVTIRQEENAARNPLISSSRTVRSLLNVGRSGGAPPNRKGIIRQNGDRVMPISRHADFVFFQEQENLLKTLFNGQNQLCVANSEVGIMGRAWRGALRRIVVACMDDANALRMSRALQLFLPYLTGYEAYLLGQVIKTMESGTSSKVRGDVLKVAFHNRNVSRILVQQVRLRLDFLWHWSTQLSWSRAFDAWGQFPIVGFTRFPATENFPSTRNHALASIFRVVLGPGAWISRAVTRREGLVTDNPNTPAQNLTAERNGFELANRNQYGTYVGRRKTNEFRFEHRLPTDESLVRTFISQPMSTMLNNGVVHVLRQLAKHWHNMLYQFSGNFAHQKMEQLDPFEMLRFHIPEVLVTLSSLRGRNQWDSQVLGPMVRRLQHLQPGKSVAVAKELVVELQRDIVVNVCGGVSLIVDPFQSWLDAVSKACDLVEQEAQQVGEITESVGLGIRLGHKLIKQLKWKIPSGGDLKKAIVDHINGMKSKDDRRKERRIRTAMTLITPRDKRTLVELIKNNLMYTKPCQLLLGRATTLLQRELRRDILNEAIRELSRGDLVEHCERGKLYWLEGGDQYGVYIYQGKTSTGHDGHRFVHLNTDFEKVVSLLDGSIRVRSYVAVAEAISRAQRAFMTIELDHGKKFPYNAFMEFTQLRCSLRQLLVISQLTCEELDNARLNMLAKMQRSNQAQLSISEVEPGVTYYMYDDLRKEYVPFVCETEYTVTGPEWQRLTRTKIVRAPPQSMIVVGGGPTGLITVIHCTESVLASGGVMKLYEARDAFVKGGSAFERAQIVRLDARWIAMLRYHLGTGFEDVFIPASGETDSQLGNILPTQAFVEITIKDLENMLHTEVSKMWSKGLIQLHSDSRVMYDPMSNSLTKYGEHLKLDDRILRFKDEYGNESFRYHSWKVADLKYKRSLSIDKINVNNEYGIYVRLENAVLPYKLIDVDHGTQVYTFKSLISGKPDLRANIADLPSVYPKGTTKHAEVEMVVLQCEKKNRHGGCIRDTLPMDKIKTMSFAMDIGRTHVVEATGKPHKSGVHFRVTPYEPHGVCCMQGIKISMGMHNFGEKRWGSGILDDIRSQNDRNTRIIGDFTKMVRSAPVARKMHEFVTDRKDRNWQMHFAQLVKKSDFPGLESVVPKIQYACAQLTSAALSFKRKTLQTRFFETGDNFYLGMEFPREYDRWKKELVADLVAPLSSKEKDTDMQDKVNKFKGTLMHHIDRLWYDGVLEVIRTGDVYNPGARHRVPRLYLINSYTNAKLGSFPVGESFRLSDDPEDKYEVMVKGITHIIVRNVEGYISKMPKSTMVKREGNLTRGPDGNNESLVALVTFPVAHYVNHRTLRHNNVEKGYVFAVIGDQQATPHFMRYSGLTGACINTMLFNNFVKQATEGVPFIERFRLYSIETNWSNGEVVQRGTGANYGDAFLRPGFSYDYVLNYLHSKVIEYRESEQDLDDILSRDWKIKLAASLVPCGMELNEEFIRAMRENFHHHVFLKFAIEAAGDWRIGGDALIETLQARKSCLAERREIRDSDSYWNEFLSGLEVDEETMKTLEEPHLAIAKRLDQICSQLIDFAKKAHLNNERTASELFNQPKPVDSILDDFAVEAQNFANSLIQSAAFASGALAFRLMDEDVSNVFSSVLAGLNIAMAFGTMTNVARYKIRNEEARVIFFQEKMLKVMKSVFSVMDRMEQDSVPIEQNPFIISLEEQVLTFLENAKYYDCEELKAFLAAYNKLKTNINDPEEIRFFMSQLTTKFIVDTYHVNSNLQEYLVKIYKTLDDMYRLLTQYVNRVNGVSEARKLFDRLTLFRNDLEGTLQLGATRFGFIKRRHLFQWDCTVVFKYFYGLFCCSSRSCILPTAPISTQTSSLIKQARHVSGLHQSQILRRDILDLEGLYWATRESDIASLIFMSSFLVFIASILFTIAFIFNIAVLKNIAFWATAISATGAILAVFHLWRKFLILVKLLVTLTRKIQNAKSQADQGNIRKVRGVTFTQILLTVARFFSAAAAAVALPWSVAVNGFIVQIDMDGSIPFWIALGAVCTAVASTLFFFVVEFVVRYNLSPKLGEFVCESFRDEIEDMYNVFSVPSNDIDTKQVQERETWEYVAREFLHRYRFDAVFAADRFGSILQYIQGGMHPPKSIE